MHKRVWVKKATGLGVTEFMLRFMAWLALSPTSFPEINGNRQNSIFCIVTGPRIDLAIDLITRLKHLFEDITFEDKNTVLNLGNVKIEAFPSHHLDSMRGLPNVKFIFLDEADFFPKGQQQEARTVSERYIGKSDAYIAMVSTPNMPGGLFESIETESQSLYHKVILGWQRGLGNIYTEQDIEQAKRSPSFEREYNLKYLGHIGNVFDPSDVDAALKQYDIIEYLDDLANPPRIQAVMGLDPGWGSSNFGIVVSHFVDGHIRIVYADQHSRQDHNEMVSTVWDLIQRYNVTKVLVDASAPSFIRALKLQWGERADYENVPKEQREYMLVEPVAFGMEHKQLLYHAKFLIENGYMDIHPSFDKLVTSIRSAWAKDGVLDKEVTSFDDILDAFRLCLRPYKEKSA
jgi:Terminase RNaseH-like domain